MEFHHVPVLLEPTMDSLALKDDGIYIDGTLGGGGHSENILLRTAPGGKLIGIDQDDEALAAASARLEKFGSRFTAVKANFCRMKQVLADLGISQADGILLDIGVSSHQLDDGERGFSYMVDAPLDMRMDQNSGGKTAADLLAVLSEEEIANIIYQYGEERYSRRIARQIVEFRKTEPVLTTFQLVNLIRRAMPKNHNKEKQHPAKRTFQALRIAVNDELGVLQKALDDALDLLKPGGRLSIITFHSLEDRIVKEQFKTWAKGCICPPDFPVCVCGKVPTAKIITRKPVTADESELELNPRARSAKLRCVEKL
ncbi:MAG: 16S rRNA (cytosine(1402)-N(4))-methyltransferase RsmH [Bacillota bacterium]|jgi:16S rRNA (cytosine1402-N4)-methyltransferase